MEVVVEEGVGEDAHAAEVGDAFEEIAKDFLLDVVEEEGARIDATDDMVTGLRVLAQYARWALGFRWDEVSVRIHGIKMLDFREFYKWYTALISRAVGFWDPQWVRRKPAGACPVIRLNTRVK